MNYDKHSENADFEDEVDRELKEMMAREKAALDEVAQEAGIE